MREDSFLEAILAEPKDDATLLVYADWLEEQGDGVSAAKCEFLRLTVQRPVLEGRNRKRRWLRARQKRLQELAAALETDWLRVVSRLPVEQCLKGQQEVPVRWEFQCPKQWQDLDATADRNVRFCWDCREQVHYCDTITTARAHAQEGHCVAIDVGVIRKKHDLLPDMRMVFGRMTLDSFEAEEERLRPDAVSEAREATKLAAAKTPPTQDEA
jgi:uncharacterized protein (TIGR02996 family)